MRGPKRATKIRKLFNLTKEDDVRKYVNTYRRSFVSATGKFSSPPDNRGMHEVVYFFLDWVLKCCLVRRSGTVC